MAKRTTRRSISIAGKTYARLKHAEPNISGYIEQLIKADLDARGVPEFDKPPPHHERKPKPIDHPNIMSF